VNTAAQTGTDPNNAFAALSGAPIVTVNSPPKVNFAVIGSDGKPVQGLTLFNAAGAGTGCSTYNVRFVIAKLVKGSGSAPDTWQDLISQVRASGNPGNFVEGTTDPVPSATVAAGTAGAGSLAYNAAGYYTYTFGTDVTNAAYIAPAAISSNKIFTNGQTLAKDGTTTYRVGMQLCYVDSDGTTKISNPLYDFTVDANGNSSKAAAMRMVVNKDSCNTCHTTLGQHGGRRVDPNFCVVCHNPGSVDYHDNNLAALGYPDGGAPIDLKYMVHKIHFGERLTKPYVVAALNANLTTYPQDQTNCTKCHDNTKAANADNWKNVPSRNACGACHDGINFATGGGTNMAGTFAGHIGGAQATDNNCTLCHSADAIANTYHVPVNTTTSTSNGFTVTSYYLSTANVNRMPAGTKTVDYQIKSVTLDASRHPQMTFRILQSGVRTDFQTYAAGVTTRLWSNFVGAPSVYFAFSVPQDGIATPADFNTYFSAGLLNIWNGTATTTSAGTLTGPDANGYYTVTLTGRTIPANAALLTGAMGYSAMYQTDVAGYLRTCPDSGTITSACSNGVNVPAQDDKLVATGFTARRITTEADRCKNCHENLGIFAESNFHSGQRNDPTMCAMCHNPNRASGGYSADSTAFVHRLHGASKRTYPDTWHATATATAGVYSVTDGYFNITLPAKNGSAKENLKNCLNCHADGGYNFAAGAAQVGNRLYRAVVTGTTPVDRTTTSSGAVLAPAAYGINLGINYGASYSSSDLVTTPPTVSQATTGVNLVNSPIANACFACHDGDMVTQPGTTTKQHIEWGGGSIYRPRGVKNDPANVATAALDHAEQCLACHGPNGIAPIKTMHGVQ
jgi:OmcA/MtrC family decaheme c-type cytochrome